jgi:hypothetical protein
MTAPSVTNILAANTLGKSGDVNINFSDLVIYLSNRNDGSASWDRVLVTSSSAVPLIVSNSTGTSAIAQFNDNGVTVFQVVDGGDAYSVDFTNYSAPSTVTGWASFTDKLIYYKKIGKLMFVWFNITGTSNSAVTTFTLPFLSSNTIATVFGIGAVDNGVSLAYMGKAVLDLNSLTLSCYVDNIGTGWTASGSKQVYGQFWYQTT